MGDTGQQGNGSDTAGALVRPAVGHERQPAAA